MFSIASCRRSRRKDLVPERCRCNRSHLQPYKSSSASEYGRCGITSFDTGRHQEPIQNSYCGPSSQAARRAPPNFDWPALALLINPGRTLHKAHGEYQEPMECIEKGVFGGRICTRQSLPAIMAVLDTGASISLVEWHANGSLCGFHVCEVARSIWWKGVKFVIAWCCCCLFLDGAATPFCNYWPI